MRVPPKPKLPPATGCRRCGEAAMTSHSPTFGSIRSWLIDVGRAIDRGTPSGFPCAISAITPIGRCCATKSFAEPRSPETGDARRRLLGHAETQFRMIWRRRSDSSAATGDTGRTLNSPGGAYDAFSTSPVGCRDRCPDISERSDGRHRHTLVDPTTLTPPLKPFRVCDEDGPWVKCDTSGPTESYENQENSRLRSPVRDDLRERDGDVSCHPMVREPPARRT